MISIIKNLFSQRKGLSVVSEIALREGMTEEVQNAIINCFYKIYRFSDLGQCLIDQVKIERELWIHFSNKKISEFAGEFSYRMVFEPFIESKESWYKKLDMIEYVCRWVNSSSDPRDKQNLALFEQSINFEFERLNYGYRIVNHMITDITSEEETRCIEDAIKESKDNVKEHLNKAIEYFKQKPESDNRNSIKESISAVEAVCRQLTGAEDLNKALKQLNEKGIPIHERFKDGIRSFYNFTNQEDTGIRHALLKEGYSPSKAEAYFMLLSCSAFINYLRMITVK